MGLCILIGAGPGVSLSIAARFGVAGSTIALVSRKAESLVSLASELEAMGIEVHWREADAGDSILLARAVAELVAVAGPCDTLIYNAAVMTPGLPFDIEPAELHAHLSVDVVGALVAARVVAPDMIERGEGTVIFTGGGLALEPYPEWTALAVGKSALRSLALALYKQLAPLGVHVSVVAICGIVEQGGPFDPGLIAEEYFRLATDARGVADREVIFQPAGTDHYYNDPDRIHRATTLPPGHVRSQGQG